MFVFLAVVPAPPLLAQVSTDYVLEAVVISSAGDKLTVLDDPPHANDTYVVIVGQAVTGTAEDAASGYTIDLGFASLLTRPDSLDVQSNWIATQTGTPRNWDFSNNWSPPVVPSDTKNTYYTVKIGPQTGVINDQCRIRNISPTIKRLRLESGFQLLVDEFSTSLVTLSFEINAAAPASSNNGIIRVTTAGPNRTFTLQSINLQQAPAAELQAGPSAGSGSCALRLVDCTITNGILHSFGNNIVRLFDSTLINVQTIGLIVDSDQTSHLSGTITNTQDISVRGTSFEPSHLIPKIDNATLTGPGTVTLTDQAGSFLGDPVGTITNSATHTIAGQGQIVGPLVNNGIIRANAGAELQIKASISGNGQFFAEDGTLSIPGATPVTVACSTLDVSSGGAAQIGGSSLFAAASYVHLGCSPGLRGCTPPVLDLATGNPQLDINGNIEFEDIVTVAISPTAIVRLAGDFANHADESSRPTFDWHAGPLTMDGAAPQSFELAGEDFGPHNPAGFVNNFAMGTLTIDPGRTVDFFDAFDNIPSSPCEVLYVDTLILGAGSTIRLHGCNIYYHTLNRDPTATVDLQNGGFLLSTHFGDLDGDSNIDSADINLFVNAVLGLGPCNPVCLAGADNGDGVLNARDIAAFIQYVISP